MLTFMMWRIPLALRWSCPAFSKPEEAGLRAAVQKYTEPCHLQKWWIEQWWSETGFMNRPLGDICPLRFLSLWASLAPVGSWAASESPAGPGTGPLLWPHSPSPEQQVSSSFPSNDLERWRLFILKSRICCAIVRNCSYSFLNSFLLLLQKTRLHCYFSLLQESETNILHFSDSPPPPQTHPVDLTLMEGILLPTAQWFPRAYILPTPAGDLSEQPSSKGSAARRMKTGHRGLQLREKQAHTPPMILEPNVRVWATSVLRRRIFSFV